MLAAALLAALLASRSQAQPTNPPAPTNAPATAAPPPPARILTESAFALIGERNIFNASRSGGQVRLPSRRPTSVEYFTLVGTMAYEKGVFAFFEGSSSEFTKVVKADDVMAGYKLADVLASSVKLEADGKLIDLPIGSQMRREDAGSWNVREASGSNGGSESASSPSRASSASSTSTPAAASADMSDVLKKLMQRREKE